MFPTPTRCRVILRWLAVEGSHDCRVALTNRWRSADGPCWSWCRGVACPTLPGAASGRQRSKSEPAIVLRRAADAWQTPGAVPPNVAKKRGGGIFRFKRTTPPSPFPFAAAWIRLTRDQRGVKRPYGPRCDLGAFEAAEIIFRNGFDGG